MRRNHKCTPKRSTGKAVKTAVAAKRTARSASSGKYVPNYAPTERAAELARALIKQYGTTLDTLKDA